MARKIEPLDRGLVTIRDPGLLKPGELSFIRNAVYLPGSQAIQRAKGRAAFGTATASALDVDGIRDVTFDNGRQYVVAHVSTAYVTALVGDTGTFGIMASGVGDGSSLEVVHYRNRFFLFNGTTGSLTATGGNLVMYLTATAVANTPITRQHGMLAVSSNPATSSAAGTFSQAVTGYYEYWTTELARVTQDGAVINLESTFEGNPTTVFVSALGQVPTIYMPPVANSAIATHWRVYRSPKKDKESDKKFPTGFMIAESAIPTGAATAGVADTFTTSDTGFKFPGTANVAGSLLSDFGDASARLTGAGADDNAYASAALSAGTRKLQGLYGFNFGGFSGNVRGIEIALEASCSVSPVLMEVRIGRNRQADGGFIPPGINNAPGVFRGLLIDNYLKVNTAARSALLTATSNPGQTITFGGSSDRWFSSEIPGFTDSDFNGNFMAQILVQAPSNASPTVAIDYLKAKVYYAGTTDSVIQFPTVAYTFGDITAQVGKNGAAPSSSTGAMYEDSLVVNDVGNPSVIRYSYPGDPEAFPSTYYLDFETSHNDRVTCIKVVNNRLIVMLRNSIYRVNYLPSERDASFDRGKAIECISNDYGCVNEMCAVVFSMGGMQERLAFVSDQGVHVTDGYTLKNWADNLDWRGDRDGLGIANTTTGNYTPVALINDIENLQLVYYFRNSAVGFGGDYFALTFQHSDFVDGLPRVAGMVTMRNNSSGNTAVPKSAWPITRSTGVTEIFLGYGASAGGVNSTAAGAGQVWRETGTNIPSTNASMVWRTRRMYLAGMGMEWRLNEVYGYTGLVSGSSPPTVTYLTDNVKTDNDGSSSSISKSYVFPASMTTKLHKVIFNQMAEGMLIQATVTGECTYAQEFMIIDGENFGKEDSGR